MKKEVRAHREASHITLSMSILEAVAGGAPTPSVRTNHSTGTNNPAPPAGGSPPGIGTQGKQKTSETVKQAAIFGTAFTGLGIAGNAMFGPEQGGQTPPPASGEPLDFM